MKTVLLTDIMVTSRNMTLAVCLLDYRPCFKTSLQNSLFKDE